MLWTFEKDPAEYYNFSLVTVCYSLAQSLTGSSTDKQVFRDKSPIDSRSRGRTLKAFFCFPPLCLFSLVRFSLLGGNRADGTHLGLDKIGLVRVCVLVKCGVCVGGVVTILVTGCWRESPVFSFSIACSEQVYIVAVPYARPRKWALLIHLRARQALVTYGPRMPV